MTVADLIRHLQQIEDKTLEVWKDAEFDLFETEVPVIDSDAFSDKKVVVI